MANGSFKTFWNKKNIIGVYWHFDDVENDDTISDNEVWEENHSNDGLYIYEVKNDEFQEIKIIEKYSHDYCSFIKLKNEIIMKYYEDYKTKILMLDKKYLSNNK